MIRMGRPGSDPAIAPAGGLTRDGQPLAEYRSPPADLAPWIDRIYFTDVNAPEQHCIACGLLADSAMLRLQVRGWWTADTAEGRRELGRAALLFGPNARRMPVSVTGASPASASRFVRVRCMCWPGSPCPI